MLVAPREGEAAEAEGPTKVLLFVPGGICPGEYWPAPPGSSGVLVGGGGDGVVVTVLMGERLLLLLLLLLNRRPGKL